MGLQRTAVRQTRSFPIVILKLREGLNVAYTVAALQAVLYSFKQTPT